MNVPVGRALGVVGLATVGLFLVTIGPAGASTKSVLDAKALSLSDFPTGWSVDNSSPTGDQGCLSSLKVVSRHETKIQVQFVDGTEPEVEEVLTSGPGAEARYKLLESALARCKGYTSTTDGTSAHVSIGAMSFPAVGQQSSAYSLSVTVEGETAGADLVLFRTGQTYGAVLYEDLGTPDPTMAQGFINEAVDKAEGKSVTPPSGDS